MGASRRCAPCWTRGSGVDARLAARAGTVAAFAVRVARTPGGRRALGPAAGAAGLAALVLAALYPALGAGFAWDDTVFLGAAPVASWTGLADIWLRPGSICW